MQFGYINGIIFIQILLFPEESRIKLDCVFRPRLHYPVNENGTKSCRFGLSFTLRRFHNRHQMKTILKTARFENDMKRFGVNA